MPQPSGHLPESSGHAEKSFQHAVFPQKKAENDENRLFWAWRCVKTNILAIPAVFADSIFCLRHA
jgi:hypothetical protein